MPSLDKPLRNLLERTVKDARDVAEAGARAAIEQLGVGDATAAAHLDEAQRNLRRRLRIHGRQLGDQRDEKKGTQETERLIEEVAYEHWHRMLFARFLAENNLLMYPDPDQPVAVSLAECDDLAADEGAANGWELAARFAAQMLPRIFRLESPVFELQLPPEHQQQLEKYVAELPVEVFTASDSLGWVYQFWQARRKEQINKSEVKIGARELPAVTQLFTEDYMVDFLLDNTLGAWWAGKVADGMSTKDTEGTKKEEKDRDQDEAAELNDEERQRCEQELRAKVALPGISWDYLRFIPVDGPDSSRSCFSCLSWTHSHWAPAAGTFNGWPKTAAELRCLDPCMGSGHFIVAMFERLVALRMAEESLEEPDAVAAVIRDNLFGLEIDPRCTQIAAFNLALAAWRRIGYCVLPPMNLACSGLAPNASREDWVALAGDDQRLRGGMERLYDTFILAPVLGSLIDPRLDEADLLAAAFQDFQPLLEAALSEELNDETTSEMAVAARGLAKAAEILAGTMTLVATNVPYLGRGKQGATLKAFLEKNHTLGRADLATAFVQRCLKYCGESGATALVTPQNWLFLTTYTRLREELLRRSEWNHVSKLGTGAFETISGEVVNVALHSFTNRKPRAGHQLAGFDVSIARSPDAKAKQLSGSGPPSMVLVTQSDQLGNPDARITLDNRPRLPLLSNYAHGVHGLGSKDTPYFFRQFWEIPRLTSEWLFLQTTVESIRDFGGCEQIVYWENGQGLLHERGQRGEAILAGGMAWGQRGVIVSQMHNLPVALYDGNIFDKNAAVVLPNDVSNLPAIWAYCSSPLYRQDIRKVDQKVNVTNVTLVKVPFDLEHWQKVAAEKYPDGLPDPESDDPTQWLFHGRPEHSTAPLQVAVARLLGYRWPAELDTEMRLSQRARKLVATCDELLPLTDEDGIVCIPAVRGEPAAADRLLDLLATAQRGNKELASLSVSGWADSLLASVGFAGKTLDNWLRDGFFAQHCDLFHQRPFVWHIWDGLRDGFAALVNYHRLDHKTLQTLIYTYLGDWITRQKHDSDNGVDGAEERLAAAEQLKKRLELILHGEAPYDIFVRWKPLHEQPIGWHPDLNDGVRMNIRPFVTVPDVKAKGAGVLRIKPKIKWQKDRGKEPQRDKADYPWFWGWDGSTDFPGGPTFTGDRHNDCHYTLAAKMAARSRATPAQTK